VIALERFRAKACPGLDPGWIAVRGEKRVKQRNRASVPIPSERKRLWRRGRIGHPLVLAINEGLRIRGACAAEKMCSVIDN
jgi:hypothetical protein